MSIALIVLLCLCGTASADLGDPWIQAVCRIKLTNGRSIEGFITMAVGGYEGIHPNGFRFESGSHETTHYLIPDFKKLVRDSSGSYEILLNDGRVVHGGTMRKASKIVFLEWEVDVVNQRWRKRYKELAALTLVTELLHELHIGPKYEALRKGSVVTIPLNRIVSFELIDHPAKKWLDHIKKRRHIAEELDKADPNPDYMESSWYHEMRDNKSYKYLKEAVERGLKDTPAK